METHRCNGSIKNKISIHRGIPYEYSMEPWWITRPDRSDYDFGFDTSFIQPICTINCCPLCGLWHEIKIEYYYEGEKY